MVSKVAPEMKTWSCFSAKGKCLEACSAGGGEVLVCKCPSRREGLLERQPEAAGEFTPGLKRAEAGDPQANKQGLSRQDFRTWRFTHLTHGPRLQSLSVVATGAQHLASYPGLSVVPHWGPRWRESEEDRGCCLLVLLDRTGLSTESC